MTTQISKNFMFSLISIAAMFKINFITNRSRSMVGTFQQLNFFTNLNFHQLGKLLNYELEIKEPLILVKFILLIMK